MAQRLGDRLEAVEQEVRTWALMTRKRLQQQLIAQGLDRRSERRRGASRVRFSRNRSGTAVAQREEPLVASLGYRLRSRDLEIYSVSFRFSRHGIFYQVGVGKNRPKGSPAASRAANPWLDVVLDPALDELADIVSEGYAHLASFIIRFQIPGVIDTNITGGRGAYRSEKFGAGIVTPDGTKVIIDPSFF